MTTMLMDAPAIERLTLQLVEHGQDTERYYCAKDARAIVIARYGLLLSDLVGRVCKVSVGWDSGNGLEVFPGQEGAPHSRCTIFLIENQRAATWTLTDFLNQAPVMLGQENSKNGIAERHENSTFD